MSNHNTPKPATTSFPGKRIISRQEAALALARERGFAVFPLKAKAKRPANDHGFKGATKDPAVIRSLWPENSQLNIAVATGEPSGIVVIDVDPRNGGDKALEELMKQHGPLPQTLTARTGDGIHYYYRYPKVPLPHGFVATLGMGIDVKSDGGYVVAPPSVHPSGPTYHFEDRETPIAPLDAWMLEHCLKKLPEPRKPRPSPASRDNNSAFYNSIEDAIAAYNHDHADSGVDWPASPSERYISPCCGHKGCFKRLGDHWFFFSTNHPHHIGKKANSGYVGDQLDLDLAAANAECIPYLKSKGYLTMSLNPPIADTVSRETTNDQEMRETSPKLPSSTIDRLGLTELGNAERFQVQFGQDVFYQCDRNKWRAWNGRHWEIDASFQVDQFMIKTLNGFYAEAAVCDDKNEKESIQRWAIRCESKNIIENSLQLARRLPGMQIQSDQLDTDLYLLNTQSGIVDLRHGTLTPHRRDALLTRISPYPYRPDAQCPKFLKFLDEITGGNRALITYIQRAFGYSLTGDTSEQVVFLLIGSGQNGKSTLMTTLQSVMGIGASGYSDQASFDTFLEQRSDRVRPDIARLSGPRLVAAIEANEGSHINEQLIKSLSGGDRMTGRFLYESEFTFTPQCKVWLCANHAPRITSTDYGTWRRIRVIPFDVCISPEKRNKNLTNELLEECAGILKWGIDGAVAWASDRAQGQDGLRTPSCVSNRSADYQRDQDTVGAFIEECCEIGAAHKESSGSLFNTFESWARVNGVGSMSERAFASRLEEKNFKKSRDSDGSRCRDGLRLKADYKLTQMSQPQNPSWSSARYGE